MIVPLGVKPKPQPADSNLVYMFIGLDHNRKPVYTLVKFERSCKMRSRIRRK